MVEHHPRSAVGAPDLQRRLSIAAIADCPAGHRHHPGLLEASRLLEEARAADPTKRPFHRLPGGCALFVVCLDGVAASDDLDVLVVSLQWSVWWTAAYLFSVPAVGDKD